MFPRHNKNGPFLKQILFPSLPPPILLIFMSFSMSTRSHNLIIHLFRARGLLVSMCRWLYIEQLLTWILIISLSSLGSSNFHIFRQNNNLVIPLVIYCKFIVSEFQTSFTVGHHNILKSCSSCRLLWGILCLPDVVGLLASISPSPVVRNRGSCNSATSGG